MVIGYRCGGWWRVSRICIHIRGVILSEEGARGVFEIFFSLSVEFPFRVKLVKNGLWLIQQYFDLATQKKTITRSHFILQMFHFQFQE